MNTPFYAESSGARRASEIIWEATHEYARYSIDTALLRAEFDISAHSSKTIDTATDPRCKIRDPHVVKGLITLLDKRYAELVGDGEVQPRGRSLGNTYSREDTPVDKLGKVRHAWLEHYFRPRTEVVGPDEFNAWVATRAQYRGLSSDTVTEQMGEPEAWPEAGIIHYWGSKALYDLKLLPHGLGTAKLIVPPNVTVTGAEGNPHVFQWDKVDDPMPLSYSTYPSTRILLAKMEREDVLVRGLSSITLDDIELGISGQDGVTD